MPVGNPRNRRFWLQLTTPLPAFLGPGAPGGWRLRPPAATAVVLRQNSQQGRFRGGDGVFRLRLETARYQPGFQDVQDGALLWLPLSIIRDLRLSGPEVDNYRQAEVVLTSGEKLRGELFVGQLIGGTTDVGYWNLSLKKVRNLDMGEE